MYWDHLQDASPEAIVEWSRKRADSDPFWDDLTEFSWTGNVFVSHTSADESWCRDNVVSPIEGEFGQDTCFFLNKNSGDQRQRMHSLVIGPACKAVKTVVIAISDNARTSGWMPLEASWALEQAHPIIICSRDSSDPSFLRSEFAHHRRSDYAHFPIELVDFTQANSMERLITIMNRPEFVPEPIYSHDVFSDGYLWNQFKKWRAEGKPRWRKGR